MKKVFRIAALVAACALSLFACSGPHSSVTVIPPAPEPEPKLVDDPTIPLTIEALADGTITLENPPSTFKYKKNDGDFETVAPSGDPPQATIAVATGDKVCLFADGTENSARGNGSCFLINCSADFCLYGNVMSLESSSDYQNCAAILADNEFACLFVGNARLKNHATLNIVLPATELTESCYDAMFDLCKLLERAPKLPATNLKEGCYKMMFQDCQSLVQAPELPAMELAKDCYRDMFYDCEKLEKAPALPAVKLKKSCYESMFAGCKSLVKAPALPATELADFCYYSMFDNCVKMTPAPALPATTLADSCYLDMFIRCKALTQAPELPATTLADGCYMQMFCQCDNLTYVKCLATNISAYQCLLSWMECVPSGGTFVKPRA